MYPFLKTLHIFCAVLSYSLFFMRGMWVLRELPVMQKRWVRIVPHLIDTLLLGSAIALTVTIQRYPFVDAWLTAKVFALLIYIGLGFVALKYGRDKAVRLSAWLAAQVVFMYIVLVAINHTPLPFIK